MVLSLGQDNCGLGFDGCKRMKGQMDSASQGSQDPTCLQCWDMFMVPGLPLAACQSGLTLSEKLASCPNGLLTVSRILAQVIHSD